MDREKLKELIKDSGEIASAVGMQEWVVEKIADHLIANGIGDITTNKLEKTLEEAYEEIKELQDFKTEVSTILCTTRELMLKSIRMLKHRADVAEEALKNGAVGEDLYCSSDDERHRLYLHLIREAEARLKELEAQNDRD